MAVNQLFTNNATTKLAAGISNAATSLTITTGTGALFPVLTGAFFFIATINELGVGTEIVKVTARTTDTFTIVRAQEGTTAKVFSTAANVYLDLTATQLQLLNDNAVINDATGIVIGGSSTGANNIVIGSGSGSGSGSTVAIGLNVAIDSAAYSSIVVGGGSKALDTAYSSIVIGNNSKALNTAHSSIVIGNNSKALDAAYNSIVIGGRGSTSRNTNSVVMGGYQEDMMSSPHLSIPQAIGANGAMPDWSFGSEHKQYCSVSTKFMTEPLDLCGGKTWVTATAFNHATYVKPTTPNGKMYYRWDSSYPFLPATAYTPSTCGTVEPTWTTTALSNVADNLAHGYFICINPANYAITFTDKFVVEGIDILVYNITGVTVQATIDIGTQASGTLLKSAHTTNLTTQWQLEKIAITPHAVDDIKINITTMATGTELLVRFVVHGYYVRHWL